MTRKHFEAVASAIRAEVDMEREEKTIVGDDHVKVLHNIARRLADQFIIDNARFDDVRFLKACGFDS